MIRCHPLGHLIKFGLQFEHYISIYIFNVYINIAGSFTSDLAAIIGVNSSGCLRQEHENELLDFYIQRMSDLSQLCSQAKNIRLNKSNVNASYKISLKCAVLQMAMTLVTNPTHDEIPANESEGPLTQRFRQLIEDIFIA